MERFQRSKYQSQVSAIRREISAWIASYKQMLLPENQGHYTNRQLEVADRRQYWLEDLVEKLEELEEDLDEEEA